MKPDPLEAIAAWVAEPSETAAHWFRERGFKVARMRVGLLLNGSRASFELVFGVELGDVTLPFAMPVPEVLRPQIASVTIPKPRQYQ